MIAKIILFCLCSVASMLTAYAVGTQGPGGEVVLKRLPPPIDEKAAERAQQAARARKQAAIADQVELALKGGNAAMNRMFDAQGASGSESVRKAALAEAESDYLRAAKLQPGDWRAFSGLGEVYYWEDRFGDSALAYKRATTLKPNDAQLYSLLARSYSAVIARMPEAAVAQRQQKQGERLHALERAVELDPRAKHPYAYQDLGSAYEGAELYDKAIATYKRLIAALAPAKAKELEDAHYNLASTYEHAKRFSEAIGEYKEAIRLNPDWFIYYRFLGRAYGEAGRYAEAVAAYQQANERRPDSDNDIRIAEVYAQAQDFEKAVAVLTRVTQLNPKNWEAFASLGRVYYLQKQQAKALEPLQQANRLSPGNPGVLYYLGLSQLMLGHKSEAMEQYEELKKLKSEYAAELLSEISKQ